MGLVLIPCGLLQYIERANNWSMNIVVLNHVSLDGVMQGPGRPDEDTRGGFIHGGWAVANGDQVMAEWIGPIGTGTGGAMLFGRRSYEGMLSHLESRGRAVQGRAERRAKIRRVEQRLNGTRVAKLNSASRRHSRSR